MGTGRAFHKAGPGIEKGLTQCLFLYGEQQIYFNLWSVDILGLLSQPDMQVGCLLGFGKLLCIF